MSIKTLWFAIFLLCLPMSIGTGCGSENGDDDDTSSTTAPSGDDDDSPIDADNDGFDADQDCDDTDPAINPDAYERCNGVDDNCDGVIDDSTSIDAGTFYEDLDGDGYGDSATELKSCIAPAGTSSFDGDCDDGDPAINPSAEEICGDDIDNNCDGTGSGCGISGTVSLDTADLTLQGVSANDQFGQVIAPGGDINGDGREDLLLSAPFADNGDISSTGVTYIFYTLPDGEANADTADAILYGEAPYDYIGLSIAGAGDVNADGYGDVLVGAPYYDPTEEKVNGGAAYLILGPIEGELSLGEADAKLVSEEKGDNAGQAVSSAGDINGDGFDDIMIGAWSTNVEVSDGGTVYIAFGPIEPELVPDPNDETHMIRLMDLADSDVIIRGQSAYGEFGKSVATLGDVNDDGFDDVLVGAPGTDAPDGTQYAGAAYLYYGPLSGALTTADADLVFYGASEGANAGETLGLAGDVNGDGAQDLLIAAPFDSTGGVESGAAYVVFWPFEDKELLATADLILIGDANFDHAGSSAAGVGDLNGDGYDDMAVGAVGSSNGPDWTQTRAVYLVYGPQLGTMNLADAGATFEPSSRYFNLGAVIGPAFDANEDGYHDLLLGVPENNDVSDWPGSVYLFYGEAGM